MVTRFTSILLIAGLLTISTGANAQEDSAAKDKRLLYVVKNGSAKDLAAILAKHFKGNADVQALMDAPSNCLLIRANPKVFAEVVKVLEQLDRRPQLVAVELLVAGITPKKGQDGKPMGRMPDEKQFTGSSKEVLEKVEALKKDGVITTLRRVELAAVENQPASARIGELKPIVTGVVTTGRGTTSRIITYRNAGTIARLTARVAAENAVVVDIDVQDARVEVPENGIEVGKDENGAPVRAAETVTATVQGKVRIRSGQAVAVVGVKTESKSGQARTLVIVTARILESGAKSGN
jgi:type II secretory pathway component GspD/PulD (secretin)